MPITFERFKEAVKPFAEPVADTVQQHIEIPITNTLKTTPESAWLIVLFFVVVLLWLTKPFWGILFGLARLGLIVLVFSVGLYVILLL